MEEDDWKVLIERRSRALWTQVLKRICYDQEDEKLKERRVEYTN